MLIKIYKERNNELLGIFLIVLAIILGFNFYFEVAGLIGEVLTTGFKRFIGDGAYILPMVFLLWGIGLIKSEEFEITVRGVGLFLLALAGVTMLHVNVQPGTEFEIALKGKGGGIIGAGTLYILRQAVGQIGVYVILGALSLVGFLLMTNLFLVTIIRNIKEKIINFISTLKEKLQFSKLKQKLIKRQEDVEDLEEVDEVLIEPEEETSVDDEQDSNQLSSSLTNDEVKDETSEINKTNEENIGEPECSADEIAVEDADGYTLPPLSLLQSIEVVDSADVNQANAKLLEETLSSFGVQAKVVDVSYGPTITRYEIQPAPGVKVSKISNLANDIALSLAAADVRIEAPIPGKAAVGIEVPNQEQVMVHLREILDTKEFKNSKSKLSVALGKDIAGKPIVANLAQMPHLLVAGATGSGKSVCINSIISSLLYKGNPDDIKLMLIDPKMVELSIYNKIPHLIAPVITDAKKAATALKWIVEEMENRYELFASSGAKGIESYNRQYSDEADERLPYVVVVIDELSDLMMVAANQVEDAICRLAQMARAAGIHLIIATQRPSVDVITGLIKANIPSRISFAVSSQTDSRTILDTGGAEKLLGKGDMLYSPVGSQKSTRIQGAFISEQEVKNLVKYVKEQDDPEYAEKIAEIKNKDITIDTEDKDELYEKAVHLVVDKRASISMLQRRLRIGYTRAARLIDTMEEEGIVGEHRGSKAREVLISEEDLEDIFDSGVE
ncbi:FtsK/SpoIIIE family DNA translocase [Selenihalanaerobacter shriftii]|uniref:FtsK/SpoIIIE family DNA translocase n=1 Tax=Selenihalanaerobacter shriftii TaxID=142842 RepID=UPI001F416ABE|nr:DNA translocase FtsK [Selenihalanaerobacter shriftii]